jgi:hypothetical protein
MAVKMLACMSSKTLEEAIEADYEKEVKTPPRSESKSDLRKTKSFTCQTLIHPSWSFKSPGNQSISPPQASPHAEGKEEVASGKPVGRGWRSFFAALQCSRAPLRSADVGSFCSNTTDESYSSTLFTPSLFDLSDDLTVKNSKVARVII